MITEKVVVQSKRAEETQPHRSVDLIILDLMLPDAKATEVLGELRREYPNIPIFLVTGNLEELDLEPFPFN